MRLTPEHHDTLAAPGVIAFCDTSSPCVGAQHPSFPALFYLDIRAELLEIIRTNHRVGEAREAVAKATRVRS